MALRAELETKEDFLKYVLNERNLACWKVKQWVKGMLANIGEIERNLLKKQGYVVASETREVRERGWLVVNDPVQCSSGSRRWVEYQPAILRSAREVLRFLDERS